MTHHLYGFQCAVSCRSLTKWLVTLVNLTVLSASLDAQIPTPTQVFAAFANIGANGVVLWNGVAKYDGATGAAINANFITGLPYAISALALSGNDLFVAWATDNTVPGPFTVSEYNATTGALINANFLTEQVEGLGLDLAVFGNNIFVADSLSNTVPEFSATTGAPVNNNFFTTSGSSYPTELAVSGNNLFVLSDTTTVNQMGTVNQTFTIGKYNATTGAVINANFITITGLNNAFGLAVSGNNLFVVTSITSASKIDTVSEYNATTGALMNANFITGLSDPGGIVVSGNNLLVPTNIYDDAYPPANSRV